MENPYEKTRVNDGFDLNNLECQYYDICKEYDPGLCSFRAPCKTRGTLRDLLEPFVSIDNLSFQINLLSPKNE